MVKRRARQASRSASRATSRPILLRYLKVSAMVFHQRHHDRFAMDNPLTTVFSVTVPSFYTASE